MSVAKPQEPIFYIPDTLQMHVYTKPANPPIHPEGTEIFTMHVVDPTNSYHSVPFIHYWAETNPLSASVRAIGIDDLNKKRNYLAFLGCIIQDTTKSIYKSPMPTICTKAGNHDASALLLPIINGNNSVICKCELTVDARINRFQYDRGFDALYGFENVDSITMSFENVDVLDKLTMSFQDNIDPKQFTAENPLVVNAHQEMLLNVVSPTTVTYYGILYETNQRRKIQHCAFDRPKIL